MVVDAETVSGSVGVSKHASLQDYFETKYELVKASLIDFSNFSSAEIRKDGDILGSAEGAMPGTIVDGEKAACSISVK